MKVIQKCKDHWKIKYIHWKLIGAITKIDFLEDGVIQIKPNFVEVFTLHKLLLLL